MYFKIPVIKPISYYRDILLLQHKFYIKCTFKWEGKKLICPTVPSELFHVNFSCRNRYFPSYPQGGRLIPFLLEGTFWVIIKDHLKLLWFFVWLFLSKKWNFSIHGRCLFCFFKLTTYRWPLVWKHISKSFTHTFSLQSVIKQSNKCHIQNVRTLWSFH